VARIAVFSKYFGYNVGGAERSMLAMMRGLEAEGHTIVAYVNASPRHYGARERRLALPPSWTLREFSLPVDWTRFRFVEYCANVGRLRRIAAGMDDIDVLYAYGPLAPALLLSFPGRKVYLARDEYALGWNRNYHRGLRAIFQQFYFMLEAPFRWRWMADLRRVAASAELLANSQFIAKGLRALAPGASVGVIPPQLDRDGLRVEYDEACRRSGMVGRGIVAVGDNILKGGDIVRAVASLMPERRFYLFDRRYAEQEVRGNLSCMPWQSSAGALYRYAEIVMVPSRVNEAMPRVVLEAQELGIPVVASSRGGSPEAVHPPSLLVENVEDAREWVEKIRSLTAHLEMQ